MLLFTHLALCACVRASAGPTRKKRGGGEHRIRIHMMGKKIRHRNDYGSTRSANAFMHENTRTHAHVQREVVVVTLGRIPNDPERKK